MKRKPTLVIKKVKPLIKKKTHEDYVMQVSRELYPHKIEERKNDNAFGLLVEFRKISDQINLLYDEQLNSYDKYTAKQKRNFDKRAQVLNKKLIEISNELEPILHVEKTKSQEAKTENAKNVNKNYSLRQIAVAYCVMGIHIDSKNAKEILNKHSQLNSVEKLLAKRFTKPSVLTKLSENKTTDTKHLNDLRAAKRLISGMNKQSKNKDAIIELTRIITAFQTSYDTKH